MLQSKQICRRNDKKEEEDAAAAYEILPPRSKLKLKVRELSCIPVNHQKALPRIMWHGKRGDEQLSLTAVTCFLDHQHDPSANSCIYVGQ